LRLFLLRHAKSDWDNKSLDDFDRPLGARGLAAAPRMGTYMREQNYVPALVRCSSSQRTRETLRHILPFFEPAPEVRYSRSLYLAEPKLLLEDIRRTPAEFSTLLLVGHNPGIGALALALAGLPIDGQEEHRKERLAEKFPTTCLAVLDFTAKEWRDIKPLSGHLVDYMRVKDLNGFGQGAEDQDG
jgi:phosphohistidine phosphatase